jgi:CDP-diacylglycerol--serine O-phosphatidyltransferase
MKQIPNLFTLLNLVFGCIAIIFILQTGETIVILEGGGETQVRLPEKIWQGSLFIFAAAVVDFLDGFLARLFKAHSAMGEQLDSLSDMVSFGVAPGMILYQLLRIGFAREQDALDIPFIALLPAFIFTCAVAWRLAKFNISTNQSDSFRGIPSPAAGLVVASLPLIIWYEYLGLQTWLINQWLLYAVIIILSWLMVSNYRFMAMKFKDWSFANNKLKYILAILSVIAIITLQWLAVPVIFILYVLLSFFSKEPAHSIVARPSGDTKDITV